ncbi:MAG TPA: Wzz/FepE/Etk N-terminal domain-containing protein, partial [Chitinophagaceae bacterium]|nr:Wzz/FepE/Etk N-terminal domain-containing protein [Chitinophagaceae bacterium]
MDLLYLFHSLLRKKWIILFSTLVGLAAGIAFSMTIKQTYTSLAQYSTGFTMGQKVKIKSEEALNIFEIDFQFKNVIETFKSPSVLGMIGYDLMLHDLESPEPFRTLTPEQQKKPAATAIGKERTKQILREKIVKLELLSNYIPEEKKVNDLLALYGYNQEALMKNILPERAMGTDYLNIWFKSENPELSAFVVNRAGEEFERFFSKIYATRTTESVGKLDSLTSAKKRELDEKTKIYEKFRTDLGAPDISGRSVAAMEVVKEATSRYTDENAKLNTLKASLKSVNDQLDALGSGTTSTVNNNAELFRLQNENKTLASQLAAKGGNDATIQNQIDANNRRILQLTPSQSGGNRAAKQQDTRDDLNRQKFQLEADIYATQQNVNLYRSKMQQYEGLANSGGGSTVL